MFCLNDAHYPPCHAKQLHDKEDNSSYIKKKQKEINEIPNQIKIQTSHRMPN